MWEKEQPEIIILKNMKKHLDIFQGMVYYNQENDFQNDVHKKEVSRWYP